MKVYQRLAADFVAEGVTHIFGIMGDGNMYWMHELDKLGGVKMLEVRHEGAGLGMADGWARVTRTPGVATATCGPGVSQLATALVTASRAASPLVAFCGEFPSNDDEYHQRMDQAAFAASCETGFIRITSPEVADDCVRKAFYRAKLESRPIMLSAPMDVQQKAFEDDDEPYKPSSTVLPKRVVHPDPAEIEKAADIIAGAKHPVIVVGRGAMWSGAGDAVKKLAERIGALIATTLMAKTWLAEDEFHVGISGTYGTRTAMQLFEEADCVIAVGASLNRYTTEHGYLYPNARFVHLDSKPHVVMGGGRAADCYVQTDAKAGVEALENALAKRSVKMTGYRTGEVKQQLAAQHVDRTEFPIEPGTVDPREICLDAGRDRAPRNRPGHGQRRDRRFLEHAVQQAALAGAARPFLRLHRADDAGGDGRDRGERQQAARARRRRRERDDAPRGIRDGGALQHAAAGRVPEQPGAGLGVLQARRAQDESRPRDRRIAGPGRCRQGVRRQGPARAQRG